MAWRIVVQPNGRFARFSDVVDNFTHSNMTEKGIFEVCRDNAGIDVTLGKIERAKENPDRFAQEIKTIRTVHGDVMADARMAEARITFEEKKSNMKKVITYYWVSHFEEETGYKHNEELPEGTDAFDVAKHVVSKGYNVMILNQPNEIVVAIDDKRFQQR